MAILPIMPDDGTDFTLKNMRETNARGFGRGMALPQTCYWFYQQVRNRPGVKTCLRIRNSGSSVWPAWPLECAAKNHRWRVSLRHPI